MGHANGRRGTVPVLEGEIPECPPGSNHLYSQAHDRRFMTTEGKRFKNKGREALAEQWRFAPPLHQGTPYELTLRFYLPTILNSTFGFPGGAASRFKKIDVSGLVKITEDLVVDLTGVDDSHNLRVVLEKYDGPRHPHIEIEIWELDDEVFLSGNLLRTRP